MKYTNLQTEELSNGKWLAEVRITEPKKYNLQFIAADEKTAKETLVKYLKSENAIEENQN